MLSKRTLLITVAVVVAVAAIAGMSLWLTTPQRVLNGFLNAVEAKDATKAMSYVSGSLKSNKRNNIKFFVDDWATGKTVATEVTSEESWRSRPIYETDANGKQVVKKNKYGYDKQELKPTPRYWAHHYHAFVTVKFDEFEDPVVVKLIRDAGDSWNPLTQLFRGWHVSQVKYQPLDDSDFEEIDAEDLFGEDATVDEDGNIIVDTGTTDDATDDEDATEDDSDDTSNDNAAEDAV